MNPETIEAEAVTAEPAQAGSECSPVRTEPRMARSVWTRDVEALCRALDAQQRAHFSSVATEKK